MNGIIVGVDGTPAAVAALRWAVDHGARHDLEVTAVAGSPRDTSCADLLVIGAHPHHWLGAVPDPTTWRSPLAVVLERTVDPDAPIVVGVDGSSAARAALRWAVTDAATEDRPVVAVHAWTIPFPGDGLPLCGDEVHRRACAARRDLERIVDGAIGRDEPVERRCEYGAPADVLCDAAADAAVLVVGSCGVGAIHRAAPGAVTQQVVERAPSTIVVIPPRF